MTPPQRLWVGLILLGLLGCHRATETTSSGPPPGIPPMMGPPGTMGPPAGFDVESGPHAAGKKVFVANGCFRCHNIGSIGAPPAPSPGFPPGPGGPGGPGRGGNRGPDLAKIGSNPEHTVDWLVEFIRKPQSKKAKARMPAFEGKISEPDLRALAEYLASLK